MAEKKYNDYEVARVVDVNPFEAVINALKKRGRRNTHTLLLLQFDWPASQDIIERLSCFITDGIKASGEPVIYPIIEEALQRYSAAVFHGKYKKHDDPARIGVFLETMITQTCRALEIRIVDSKGASWLVARGQPLSHWIYEHPGDLTIYSHAHDDEPALRGLLYELLTCESVKKVLERKGYGEAVVAGRLAAGH